MQLRENDKPTLSIRLHMHHAMVNCQLAGADPNTAAVFFNSAAEATTPDSLVTCAMRDEANVSGMLHPTCV